MKPRRSNRTTAAMTLFEVAVVIAALMIAAALLLPRLLNSRRIYCVNNLRQVGIAFRIWAGDNNDKYPMGMSVTNGGTMELAAAGDVVATFQVMSNELSTPKILACPEDADRIPRLSFVGLVGNSNISYFVGVDVTNDLNPQMFLSGDDNFAIGGVSVKSGLLRVWTNAPLAWTAARHFHRGNIGFADDSVLQTDDQLLIQKLQETGLATNRLAIP